MKVTLLFVGDGPLGIVTLNVVSSIGVPSRGFVKLPPNQIIGVPGVEVAFGRVYRSNWDRLTLKATSAPFGSCPATKGPDWVRCPDG